LRTVPRARRIPILRPSRGCPDSSIVSFG
jgi:hypothetical protein